MDEEKELVLRKYAELYEHSKAVLAEEIARSSRTDEKASKYLTALSLVLGALVFFFQQLVEKNLLPPKGMLDLYCRKNTKPSVSSHETLFFGSSSFDVELTDLNQFG